MIRFNSSTLVTLLALTRRRSLGILTVALLLAPTGISVNAQPQNSAPAPAPSNAPPPAAPKSPPMRTPDKPKSSVPSSSANHKSTPESELARVVRDAGNDRAALVRNLKDYLERFPETPEKPSIYRALVESEVQLHNDNAALDYAERLIVLQPDNAEMMLFAIRLLKQRGDTDGLTRASDYATRVLERVQTRSPETKPAQLSQAEWDTSRSKLEMMIYVIRGELELDLKQIDAAAADLEKSYSLNPNAEAALHLGEIAELRRQPERAIAYYASAFVVPDQEGSTIDRSELRDKLSNLWQLEHGSEAGLGERLLQAYDEASVRAESVSPQAEHNANAAEPYGVVLGRPGNSPAYNFADARGKVAVLSFWTTWCMECREAQPALEQARIAFADRDDIVFLSVNTDRDESRVQPFLDRHAMGSTVVFAEGFDRLLQVNTVPAIVILDRSGKVAARLDFTTPGEFLPALKSAIEKNLAPSN